MFPLFPPDTTRRFEVGLCQAGYVVAYRILASLLYFCEQIKLNPTEATQSMFCFNFSDKIVALTANRKLGISKFYEWLSEPQTNQPQFITKCSHCVSKYPLLLQTFKTCDCSQARCRSIGQVGKSLYTHVAFVLVWSLESYTTKDNNFLRLVTDFLKIKSCFLKRCIKLG